MLGQQNASRQLLNLWVHKNCPLSLWRPNFVINIHQGWPWIFHQAFMVKGKICYKHSLRDYHLSHQAFTGMDTFKTRPSKWRNRVPFNFKAWHHECKHSNVCQMSSQIINSNQYFNLINFSNNNKKMKYASGNKALISNKCWPGTCFGGEDPLLQFFMKVKNCQHWF